MSMSGEGPEKGARKTTSSTEYNVPGEWKCRFCGGASCKYEPKNWERWTKNGTVTMPVHGLYSSWVTGDILAHARPSQWAIENHKLVDQFESLGIRAIINCQKRGEHARCGDGNLPGGFSYDPDSFTSRGIHFYNFSWKDMTTPRVEQMLDIVQVMDFVIESGGKVAVHCHAGLGRTGLCIASYLLFSGRCTDPREALTTVRTARPGSVQTRRQEIFIDTFAKTMASLRLTFAPPGTKNLSHHLRAQARILHGYEKRRLKFVPRAVSEITRRLLALSDPGSGWSSASQASSSSAAGASAPQTLGAALAAGIARGGAAAATDVEAKLHAADGDAASQSSQASSQSSSSTQSAPARQRGARDAPSSILRRAAALDDDVSHLGAGVAELAPNPRAIEAIRTAANAGNWAPLRTCSDANVLGYLLCDFLHSLRKPIIPVQLRNRALESPGDVAPLDRLGKPELVTLLTVVQALRGIPADISLESSLGMFETMASALFHATPSGGAVLGDIEVLGRFIQAVVDHWEPQIEPSLAYLMKL